MRSVEFKQESFEELSHWVVQDRKAYQRIVILSLRVHYDD